MTLATLIMTAISLSATLTNISISRKASSSLDDEDEYKDDYKINNIL